MHERGDISIGDALTAAAVLGATDLDGFLAVSRALDLAVPATSAVARDDSGAAPPVPPSAASATPATAEATASAFDATTGTPVAARLREEEGAQPVPAWLDGAAVLPGPGSGSFGVPPEPPLPAAQTRSSMILLTATWRRGRRLDVAGLVRLATLLRPPSASFRAELRTASFVQILVDTGEAMQPYADDLTFLAAHLTSVAGLDRVEERTFAGSPRRGLDQDPFTGETRPWPPPPAGSLVIILSDLGTGGPPGGRDRAPAREWSAVAATIAAAQAHVRVLTPFPLRRVPAGLAQKLRVISWDDLANLVLLRG